MTYRLYRLADVASSGDDDLLLGVYEDFEDALAARDEDTVQVFAATLAGEVMTVRHDIVGPGAQGPATSHPATTAVQRRGSGDPAELEEVRGWLARIHATIG